MDSSFFWGVFWGLLDKNKLQVISGEFTCTKKTPAPLQASTAKLKWDSPKLRLKKGFPTWNEQQKHLEMDDSKITFLLGRPIVSGDKYWSVFFAGSPYLLESFPQFPAVNQARFLCKKGRVFHVQIVYVPKCQPSNLNPVYPNCSASCNIISEIIKSCLYL